MLIYDPFIRNYDILQILFNANHVHFFDQEPKPRFTLASNPQNQGNLQAALNYIILQ
jgi:hypothetical protein